VEMSKSLTKVNTLTLTLTLTDIVGRIIQNVQQRTIRAASSLDQTTQTHHHSSYQDHY
jgi:hypothetical protein